MKFKSWIYENEIQFFEISLSITMNKHLLPNKLFTVYDNGVRYSIFSKSMFEKNIDVSGCYEI